MRVLIVGNDHEVSIRDLAHQVKAIVGSSSDIHFTPYSAVFDSEFEDVPRRVPDISKLRDLTGFEPTVQLPEIISRTESFWREAGPDRRPNAAPGPEPHVPFGVVPEGSLEVPAL